MSFLLDTDICSAYLKGDTRLWQRFQQYGGQLHVSVITVGELYTWAYRARSSAKRLTAVASFLSDVTLLEIDSEVARQFGRTRAERLDGGKQGSTADLSNVAIALVYRLTMVTHNVADYAEIPGLLVEDWLGA